MHENRICKNSPIGNLPYHNKTERIFYNPFHVRCGFCRVLRDRTYFSSTTMSHTSDTTAAKVRLNLEPPLVADGKHRSVRLLIATLGEVPSAYDCATAMAFAIDMGDTVAVQYLVDALGGWSVGRVMECLVDHTASVEAICSAVKRSTKRVYLSSDSLEKAAIGGYRDSVAVLVRHHAIDDIPMIRLATNRLARDGHAAGARLLFQVCACEPCIGAGRYAECLRDALSNAAHNSTRSVMDALAPLCTPDILRAALVASPGNSKSCYAFEEIWRHADGKVCVHEVASDLGQSVARLFVRRTIRQLGKGVACKSMDCIYAHRRDGVVYQPDRPGQYDALVFA